TEAVHESGLEIDAETFTRNREGIAKAVRLFSDPKVVEMVKKAKTIEVNRNFLTGMAFVDPRIEKQDEAYLRDIKEELQEEGTIMGYNANCKKIFVNINRVTSEDIKNGVFCHEVFHAKIEQDHHQEFRALEKRFGFSMWGETKNREAESLVASFQEVTAQIKTFDFMRGDQSFVREIHNKYGLEPQDFGSASSFIGACSRNKKDHTFNTDGLNKIAEAIVVFDHIHQTTSNILREEMENDLNLFKTFEPIHKHVFQLVDCFSSATDLTKTSFDKLGGVLHNITGR
ncbi:unnamed protein product, partial [marine sediment metagenome]